MQHVYHPTGDLGGPPNAPCIARRHPPDLVQILISLGERLPEWALTDYLVEVFRGEQ
jgi:hypothetical protein